MIITSMKQTKSEANTLSMDSLYKDFRDLVKLTWKHKDKSVKEFADWLVDNLSGVDWYGFLFAVAAFCNLNECKRVDAWDAIFDILESRKPGKGSPEYKLALDSYYTDATSFTNPEDIVKHCLYVLWNKVNVGLALRQMRLKGYGNTYEEAYPVLAVCLSMKTNGRGDLSSSYASDMKEWFDMMFSKEERRSVAHNRRRRRRNESVADGWISSVEDLYDLDFMDGDSNGYYGDGGSSKYRSIECLIDPDEGSFLVAFERVDVDGIVEEFFDMRHMGDKGRSTEMGPEDFTDEYIRKCVKDMILSGDFSETPRVEELWSERNNAISVEDLYFYLDAYAEKQEDLLLQAEWDAVTAICEQLGIEEY